MKKIRLNVDELEVHSFETEAAPEPRGTVRGRQSFYYTEHTNCYPDCYHTLNGDESCYRLCQRYTWEFNTCMQTGETCGASCDWYCDSAVNCPTDQCGPTYPPVCYV